MQGPALRRRGVSIVYIGLSMVVLLGFCSLAVDLARVQAAKTALELATDASARAAAGALASGIETAAQSAAYVLANANVADGNMVSIDSINNVAFLNWPSTTPLSGQARSNANAIQVSTSLSVPLLFAQAIGIPNATVHATSTAKAVTAAESYQLVGLNSVSLNSGNYTDSYNSSLGSYASQTHGSQGSVASNGSVTIYSGGVINGNIYYSGVTPTVASVGGTCTGSQIHLGSAIAFPTPAAPGGAVSLGNINITYAAQNQTITAGTYTCTGITVDSGCTLTINASSGPVNIYCSGAVTGNGGVITTTNNIPNNFHLYMTNSSAVQLNSGSHWYMVVYAPLSDITLTASADLYGAAVGKTLTIDSGTYLHYDTSLGTNGSAGGSGTTTISQVQ